MCPLCSFPLLFSLSLCLGLNLPLGTIQHAQIFYERSSQPVFAGPYLCGPALSVSLPSCHLTAQQLWPAVPSIRLDCRLACPALSQVLAQMMRGARRMEADFRSHNQFLQTNGQEPSQITQQHTPGTFPNTLYFRETELKSQPTGLHQSPARSLTVISSCK